MQASKTSSKPRVKCMPKTQPFRLRQLFSSQRDKWVLAAVLAIITALSVIGLLMVSGWFISAAAIAGIVALGSHSFNYMVPAAVIRVLAMVRTAGRYGEMMLSHHAVFGLLQQLRVRFFSRFAKLPLAHLSDTVQSSHAMHRLTHDIEMLNEFPLRVVSPWLIAVAGTLLVGALLFFYYPNFWVVLMLGVACLLLPALLALFGKQQAIDRQTLAESRRVSLLNPLSALTHLLIWQRWDSQLDAFHGYEAENIYEQRRTQHYQSLAMLIMQWLIAGVMIALLWHFYHKPDSMSVPILLALMLGILGIIDVVAPLVTHYLAFGNSVAAKYKLNALLDTPTSELLTHNAPLTSFDNLQTPLTLTVHDLDAKLPQAIVGVKDLHFTVTQGQPLLITGRSGAGKSTLLQVLAHELLPQHGSIALNGIDWQTLQTVPNLIGYLGQQIDIFDQTLATNLRLGKADATDEELWQVLDIVGLKAWAQAQPKQLDTPLGEYGQAISGGQARRIALARLLLIPKKVLLLDEPFAGLDKDSREVLWQNLVAHQQYGILVIVTHHVWHMTQSVNVLRLPEPSL